MTGSSSGIGAAIAGTFAERGATVVVNSASWVEAGEQPAAELPGASYALADVGDPRQAARLVATTVERHGRLDIVVNDAGHHRGGRAHRRGRCDERRLGAGVAGERRGHVERDPRRGTTPTRRGGGCHPQRQPDHGRPAGGVVDPLRRVRGGAERADRAVRQRPRARDPCPLRRPRSWTPRRDGWSVPWPPPRPPTSPTP